MTKAFSFSLSSSHTLVCFADHATITISSRGTKLNFTYFMDPRNWENLPKEHICKENMCQTDKTLIGLILFSWFVLDDTKITSIQVSASVLDRQIALKNRLSCSHSTLRAEVSSPHFKLDRRENSTMNQTNLLSMRKGHNHVYVYDAG